MSWAGTAMFYGQLGSMIRAGLAIPKALEMAGNTAGGGYRTRGRAWAESCSKGTSVTDALQGEPPLAVALVRAGEASGKLPELCARIEAIYQERVALRGLVVGKLIYPIILLHAMLVIPAVPGVFLGTSEPFALIKGPLIAWAVLIGLWTAFHVTGRGRLLAQGMLIWPLSGLTVPLITANTCVVLAASLGSGMMARRALELSAAASGNQVIGERLRDAALGIETHRLSSVADALKEIGVMPVVVDLAAAGEVSGQLESALGRCANLARETFATRSTWTARVFTGTVYAAIAIATAMSIISMYSGYLGAVQSVTE